MLARSLLIGAAAALLVAAAAPANSCDFPPEGFRAGPRNEYRGRYTNQEYRYSVTIPDRMSGYDQVTPPHHGFGLEVGTPPYGFIYVSGEANSLEYGSAMDAVLDRLQGLREERKRIDSVTIEERKLGALDGALLVARYRCQGSEKRYVQASVIALGPDGTVYEASLYADAARYQEDRTLFEQMLATWKYLGPRPKQAAP